MLMIGIRKFVSYQNFADMFTLKVLIISGHLLELPMYLLFRQIAISNYISIPIQHIIHCNFGYNSVTYKHVIFIFNESCKT